LITDLEIKNASSDKPEEAFYFENTLIS
jgi:hypothetical protein